MYSFESDYFLRMRCDLMKKKWLEPAVEQGMIDTFSQNLGISPILARILYNRGIHDLQEADHFLHDTSDDLYDPFLMKDMKKAVVRIAAALERKEKIVIYGDYDVDGITSTSLLYSVLRDLGGTPDYHIPRRHTEGYGLNEEALESLAEAETDLLITVDCGIASHDLVQAFKDRMTIIVTDHHTPPDPLPPAYAILNPKQPGCPYPFKDLAGAGVAYKLCQALWQYLRHDSLPGYTELAALATIADLVSLSGENRILVTTGLQRMQEGYNTGLQALLKQAGLEDKPISAGRIAFTVAPRLNAAGRLEDAVQGVKLLLETDPDEALAEAKKLSDLNTERQEIERQITAKAKEQILAGGHEHDGVLIAWGGPEWNPGVIGIAASRLVEAFYRPTLVISVKDHVGKGSCRSIAGFNMYEALSSAADILIQFGGHQMAAGFSVAEDQIEALRTRLNEYAGAHMTAEDYEPKLKLDGTLQASDVTLELIEELSRLEPYGMGNSRPVFALRHMLISDKWKMGQDKKHLRLTVADAQGIAVKGVGWSMAEEYDDLAEGDEADIAFQLEMNEYQGNKTPQMVVQDIHADTERPVLDRETMVTVYRTLRQFVPEKGLSVAIARQKLADLLAGTYDAHTVRAALQVLLEIGVLAAWKMPSESVLYFPQLAGKMQLETSPTYKKYGQA